MEKNIYVKQEINVKFNNESYHPVCNNLHIYFHMENVWGIDDGHHEFGDLVPQSIKDLEEKMKWDEMNRYVYVDRIELIEEYMANAEAKIRYIFAYNRDNLNQRIKDNNLSDSPEEMTDEEVFRTLYDFYGITMDDDNREETLEVLPCSPEAFDMLENPLALLYDGHMGLVFEWQTYDVEKIDDKLNITFGIDPYMNEGQDEVALTYDANQQVLSGLDDLISITELPQSELATAIEKLYRVISEYNCGDWFRGCIRCPYSEIEGVFKSTFKHDLTIINKALN